LRGRRVHSDHLRHKDWRHDFNYGATKATVQLVCCTCICANVRHVITFVVSVIVVFCVDFGVVVVMYDVIIFCIVFIKWSKGRNFLVIWKIVLRLVAADGESGINQPINQNQNQISAVSTLISIAEALQKYPKENKYLKPLLQ